MDNKSIVNFQTGRKVALIMGGVVYFGVVLLFLVFFQSLMADRFTGLMKVTAQFGAVLVALNALALPVALHYYAVTGPHKGVGIAFYALDILFMGLNVVVAANPDVSALPVLLQKYSEYAPASIILTILGWAVLFMVDPGQRALVKLAESIVNAQAEIVKEAAAYVSSDAGQNAVVRPFAAKLAGKVFNERSLLGNPEALPMLPSGSPIDQNALVAAILSKISQVTPNVTPIPASNTIINASDTVGVTEPTEVTPTVTPKDNGGLASVVRDILTELLPGPGVTDPADVTPQVTPNATEDSPAETPFHSGAK